LHQHSLVKGLKARIIPKVLEFFIVKRGSVTVNIKEKRVKGKGIESRGL